ncbi:hypothetical protein PIB30_118935 [Stylosanthes scabra]|uniref:Uncharacterized protein n=1 Tax=Stylosanthes scabra TaxID=79078 RepID=A0ABU6Z8X0_9FABA|nr:hypothetical protein [Stylosanthes scabra]
MDDIGASRWLLEPSHRRGIIMDYKRLPLSVDAKLQAICDKLALSYWEEPAGDPNRSMLIRRRRGTRWYGDRRRRKYNGEDIDNRERRGTRWYGDRRRRKYNGEDIDNRD